MAFTVWVDRTTALEMWMKARRKAWRIVARVINNWEQGIHHFAAGVRWFCTQDQASNIQLLHLKHPLAAKLWHCHDHGCNGGWAMLSKNLVGWLFPPPFRISGVSISWCPSNHSRCRTSHKSTAATQDFSNKCSERVQRLLALRILSYFFIREWKWGLVLCLKKLVCLSGMACFGRDCWRWRNVLMVAQ